MKYLKLMFSAGILFFAIACKKEEGCTDSDAVNYNSDAEINDESCTYQGKMVLWFDEETADSLDNSGVTLITYYIDDEIEGGSNISDFQMSEPECADDVSFTYKASFGAAKSGMVTYRVNNQYGEEIWTDNVTLEANSCKAIELEF